MESTEPRRCLLALRTDDCRGRQRWTLSVDTPRFAMTKRPCRVAPPTSSQIPSPRYSWTISRSQARSKIDLGSITTHHQSSLHALPALKQPPPKNNKSDCRVSGEPLLRRDHFQPRCGQCRRSRKTCRKRCKSTSGER
jgi:hypothetical protein